MNSLFDLLPLNIWENISYYCFIEFRILSKESYNISMIHYPTDIKQKIWNKYYKRKIPLIMITNLLNDGIYDINESINQFNNTFLFHSCRNDDIKSVEYLLENNANIYKYDRLKNYTPLHITSNIDIAKCLINKANDNYNNGNSDLSLLEYINIKNEHGDIPLHKACYQNDIDIVKLLIENGADINIKNKYGNTPLYWACRRNNIDIIKLLVENGADINIKNNHGDTPFHLVNNEIFEYLINHKNKKKKRLY